MYYLSKTNEVAKLGSGSVFVKQKNERLELWLLKYSV